MRIVGGTLKGRVLYGFEGKDIRPTSDSARESLFNILGKDVCGAEFLDLFSGTGAVGAEALSRGARVTFNDLSADSVRLINANLKKIGAENAGEFTVCRSDAKAFISGCAKKFDIVFLDPPYSSPDNREVLSSVNTVLKEDGIVVFENEKVPTGAITGLVLFDVRVYGRAKLCFFKKRKDGCAFYAGTFGPVTVGHYSSLKATADGFGKVIAVVGENPDKTPIFSEEERENLLKRAFSGDGRISVVRYSQFGGKDGYIKFLKDSGARYFVRGIRNEEDFAYEKKAERRNSAEYPDFQTAYIFCEEEYRRVRSKAVRARLKKGGDVTEFIPENARELFSQYIRETPRL